MRPFCRVPSFLLLAALCLTAAGARAQAGRPRRAPMGTIRGRVNPPSALRSGTLSFQVDGAAVRPQVSRSGFTLRRVPAGTHTLSVVDTASGAGSHRAVTVRRGGSTNVGTIPLQPGGQITGIVSRLTDPNGALEPLAGVEVVAEREDDPVPLDAAVRLEAFTGDDGVYSFRAVAPGFYRVSVVVPGLEAGVAFVFVEVGRTSVADFILQEAIAPGVGTVSGVVSAGGAPVEGALVTIYSNDFLPPTVRPADVRAAAARGKAYRATPLSLIRGVFATLTDQNGHYSLNVPSGRLLLEVYADGFLPVSLPVVLHARETQTVDVSLDPLPPPEAGGVEGFVIDAQSGAPLKGAEVEVLVPIVDTHPGRLFFAVTDEQGYYRIDQVPPGVWTVQARLDGYQTGAQEAKFGGLETVRLDFALKANRQRNRR